MPIYIAMLRGINVSGQKLIKMEALRAAFAAMGFAEVQTYIQSGNVVFRAGKTLAAALEKSIATKIRADFGFDVPVIVRSAAELEACLQNNPLRAQAEQDDQRSLVTFLSGKAPAGAAELLQPFADKSDRLAVVGREIFLHCPDGYGQTKMTNALMEKKLSLTATTRNWRTVKTLSAMAQS